MSKAFRPVRAFVSLFLLCVLSAGAALAAESTPNDAARFLAGLAPADGTPLAKRSDEAGWKRHASFFNGAWAKLEKRQLSKIKTWRSENLTAPQPVLFYMFSGPDFLYADAFFPKATTYVLSGLEPIGKVPELSEIGGRSLNAELRGLQASLNTVLAYSFFKTRNMKTQLRAGKVNGTLPVLYVFLARAGKTIDEVSYVDVDMEGVAHPAGEKNAKDLTKGVKIVFSSGADTPKQTLYYFTTDLSNGGAKKSGFLKFCETLGHGDAFVKSASYLMHSGGFSTVRDFLLENSVALLQDDFGIPVKYFDKDRWELHPYGHYRGPIPLFRGNYQNQLARLFKNGDRKSIDFGVGYRWRSNELNLMLAVKTPVKAAAVQ